MEVPHNETRNMKHWKSVKKDIHRSSFAKHLKSKLHGEK